MTRELDLYHALAAAEALAAGGLSAANAIAAAAARHRVPVTQLQAVVAAKWLAIGLARDLAEQDGKVAA